MSVIATSAIDTERDLVIRESPNPRHHNIFICQVSRIHRHCAAWRNDWGESRSLNDPCKSVPYRGPATVIIPTSESD